MFSNPSRLVRLGLSGALALACLTTAAILSPPAIAGTGGMTTPAPTVEGSKAKLVHGKATTVQHDGEGLFRGLPAGFEAGRYHSLAATRIPDELEICATAPDGEVMAVRHRTLPVHGLQFHPESVLTPVGPDLARNFLEAA